MVEVSGFSKLTKQEKLDFVCEQYFNGSMGAKELMKSFWHNDPSEQKVFDEFSENTLTNFFLPFGIVPNVKINDKLYCVPMVIEESSVVAASAKASKFWLKRGGFKAEVLGREKIGQVHFNWGGEDSVLLFEFFNTIKENLIQELRPLSFNMEERGGGILGLELIDQTHLEKGYYQIKMVFDTCDAMGANFINTILETTGKNFGELLRERFSGPEADYQVVMAILSNYTPDCKVRAWAECSIEELSDDSHGMDGQTFAQKFEQAIRIAQLDVHRATTHNKGIMNGIDAVILATGNDFRAIEACAHTYAFKDGQYRGLSNCKIENGKFLFELEIPLSLGTIGGLTSLHPMAKMSLDILESPNAEDLMKIVAVAGLAQNFAAIRSLVTSGIQKGHMKMHLMNILNQLQVTDGERAKAKEYFKDEIISFNGVRDFIQQLRKLH